MKQLFNVVLISMLSMFLLQCESSSDESQGSGENEKPEYYLEYTEGNKTKLFYIYPDGYEDDWEKQGFYISGDGGPYRVRVFSHETIEEFIISLGDDLFGEDNIVAVDTYYGELLQIASYNGDNEYYTAFAYGGTSQITINKWEGPGGITEGEFFGILEPDDTSLDDIMLDGKFVLPVTDKVLL
jgi:hypothetical protein